MQVDSLPSTAPGKPSFIITIFKKPLWDNVEYKKTEIDKENQRYQGNISCKDALDKGQKWMDLTEAEDIKKKCQEYTEKLSKKKKIHTQIITMV